MSRRKEIRKFQMQQEYIWCPRGHDNWVTFAEIMEKDILRCKQCNERLSFDREEWRKRHFKPPPKSIDEKINERQEGRTRGHALEQRTQSGASLKE
jgi:hypothetical protein